MASGVLRRSLLYVPASSQKMLSKSLNLASDNITYDLEDSVTPTAKPAARTALRDHLASLPARPKTVSELAVRINSVESPHALADLTTLAPLANVDAIVIPKVNSASDLTFVTDVLRHVAPERHPTSPPPSSLSSSSSPATADAPPPPIKLLALVESARSVVNLGEICAASPYLSGLIFAAEDFALDLSLTRTPSLTEFLYARSAIATAARAAGLASTIDLVCTAYRGADGVARLEEECRGGREMGFNGKQCIHPSQVAVVQRMFAPGEAEVEWAVKVVVGDDKAAGQGRGAWTLEGKMVDAPVVGRARAVVQLAERCGFDVEGMRERWRDLEPE